MTGSEHYREAEQILRELLRGEKGEPGDGGFPRGELLAIAQVHATLALAAATAVGTAGPDGRAWSEAAGTRLAPPGPPHDPDVPRPPALEP